MQKVFPISASIMNYSWGKIGKDSLAHKLLGQVKDDQPYAELWYGAHPKSSSTLTSDKNYSSLLDLINAKPELIGKLKSFSFLAKYLSINEALSIQAHPSIEQAKILNERDPANYPDRNHKPEVAIALSEVSMLHGWISKAEFEELENDFPHIRELGIKEWGPEQKKLLLRYIFNSEQASTLNKQIADEIKAKNLISEKEQVFLDLLDKYSLSDPGVSLVLFLRLLKLKPLESIYTPAGQIHAYLKGDLFECMANSDNVIRAGLTPKFIDKTALLEFADFHDCKIQIMQPKPFLSDPAFMAFADQSSEFKVLFKQDLKDQLSIKFQNDTPELIIVNSGEIQILDQQEIFKLSQGQAAFIIAAKGQNFDLTLKSDNASFFRVLAAND